MYDTNDLVKAIKQLGVDAFEATKPVNILFGKVLSESPLQIQVDQKMTLSDKQLILTRNVTNYTTTVTMNWKTETKSLNANHSHSVSGDGSENITVEEKEISLSHYHDISGTKSITINNKLHVNEQVILLRMQGGQKYIVLDRIGG